MADRNPLLNIFHVTGCLDMGGQEKLLVEFARHADRSRFALHFVTLEKRGPLARDLEAEGWPVTALDVRAGLRPGLIVRLAHLFRKGGADAVHTHNERPLIYAAPAAWLARVRRVIHTKHGRGVDISRRQNRLANFAARLADRYVCVSEDCTRLTIAQGMPASRVETLRNGIDTRHYAYSGPCAGGPAIVVARLVPEKDIGTLLRATAILVREQPTFQLKIAGDGPCMPELRRLSAELGIDRHVEFLGMVRDVAGLLATAGQYVLSSVSEGVSLTVLEAMARGLPVVATRVGGTPEVVVDRQTGLLVPPSQPAALAQAMAALTHDGEQARRLGAAGRRRVERHFDIRRMVSDYEGMYVGGIQPKLTEDRHDGVDDGLDGGARRRGGLRRSALAAAARD
jgi:glycosyltransferase involved in cell wall biosynthesis